MLNGLEVFLQNEGMDENEALNVLKENTVISDNCITANDVCNSDCLLAITFLIEHKRIPTSSPHCLKTGE